MNGLLSRRAVLGGIAAAAVNGYGEGTQPEALKIVVAGGHPGDPECGCAGTIARYAAGGSHVVLLYLNRGEGYCGAAQASAERCASVRTREANEACRILRARAIFATQVDGQAVVDNAHYEEFGKLLEAEKPDVLFTQWPLDSHRDHRAVAALVLDAWLAAGKKSELYFYEVTDDTMTFSPTAYVDISGVEQQRRAACYAHASQSPEKWYPRQTELTRFRGRESGFREAEAFVRHRESRGETLPR